MRKYIMQELDPELANFSAYFDDDGMTSANGEYYAVYINDGHAYSSGGFNMDEFRHFYDEFSDIIEAVGDMEISLGEYESVNEIFESYDVKIPTDKYSALEELVYTCIEHNFIITNEDIADYLTIKTGKKWSVEGFTGYSQGNYCEVIYCEDSYSSESINEIGHMWLGCGSEFRCIDCDENGSPTDEEYYGYFVLDTIVWTEDIRLVEYLADQIGCEPNELEVQLFDGYIKTPKYTTVEV